MKRNDWERVFIQSKVNGAPYVEPPEPPVHALWPKGTWFQRRIAELKVEQATPELEKT